MREMLPEERDVKGRQSAKTEGEEGGGGGRGSRGRDGGKSRRKMRRRSSSQETAKGERISKRSTH